MHYLSQGYAAPPPATAGFSGNYAAFEAPAQSRLEYITRSDSISPLSASVPYARNILALPQELQNAYCFSTTASTRKPSSYFLTAPPASLLLYKPADSISYKPSASDNFSPIFSPQPEYHFQPDLFLRPGKEGRFIGKAGEIREDIEKAFGLLAGEPFPDDIKLSVLPAEEFRKLAPHPSTVGISLNRRRYGLLSEIFVLNDSLGRVMLTIGHEIGHVLTPPLAEKLNEEAKAYAFSLQWMEIIRKHDIAGLAGALVAETPAENGLHDVAFSFVHGLLREGKSPEEIHMGLTEGMLAAAA